MAGVASFFSARGRAGPLRFFLVASIAFVLLQAGVVLMIRGGTAAYLLTGLVGGAVLAKLVAEAGRRLHDTGRSGWWGVLVGLVLLGVLLMATVTSLSYEPAWAFPVVATVVALVAAWFLLRPGEPAANRYGDRASKPLAASSDAGDDKSARALGWTFVSVLGCAIIGFAIISASEAMRERREADARFVEEQQRGTDSEGSR